MLRLTQPLASIAHHSSDDILAHPRFPVARMAYVEAVLRLYENDPFMNRLLLEAGRVVLFCVITCLHARYDEADRATWPTLRLLRDTLAQFGLSSPRRIDDIVARLLHTGYLEQRASKWDRRVRLLTPTAKMLAHDQDWLAAHYAPLDIMFPEPGYAPPMNRDPAFQMAQRLASVSIFPWSARIMSSNPAVMLFLSREAGVMVLIKLVQMAVADEGSEGLSFADIGARFGVSRTHVRGIVQDAAQLGLARLSGRGGRFVRLTPVLLQAFDRFLADGMSGHDLTFKMALDQLASAPRSLGAGLDAG